MDAVAAGIAAAEPEPAPGDEWPRVAVIGRPNVGKSTLVNRLLAEERLLTFPEPGTTRDAIDVLVRRKERAFWLIDTAGIRRQRSIHEKLERVCVIRALEALDRADVAWLLLDAEEGIAEQDAKIAGFVHEKGKGLVLVVNKWDLTRGEADAARRIRDEIERKLQFVSFAPVIQVSARTGSRVEKLLALTDDVWVEHGRRVATAPLNRFFREVLAQHPPPSDKGRSVKLYFITQVAVRPPSFVVSVNHPEGLHFSYKRYVVNQLREAFGFAGVPIRVFYRRRKQQAAGAAGAR
jgi:GTP-binding protein